jgi:hypothetical protein
VQKHETAALNSVQYAASAPLPASTIEPMLAPTSFAIELSRHNHRDDSDGAAE